MYTFVVVVLNIFIQFFFPARERHALSPVAANALFLDGAVKPLNVSIVIRSVEPGMPGMDTSSLHLLLKVPSVLWAVVTLHHSKTKAEDCLGVTDGLSGQSLAKGRGQHGVCHARLEVNNSVVV